MHTNKLISITKQGSKTTYTLAIGTKLSEVMKELPHGIINKNYTGIGGTTLELDCNRNSIVVEPLKETAWTKSQKTSRSNHNKIHYFGTKSYIQVKTSKKIRTISAKEIKIEELKKNLKEYIEECNVLKQPIKICTVSDQVERLFDILNESYAELKDTFHLLLDEIDHMQEASSYREVMFKCIDIYKNHPTLKRSLLSATIKKFHDPVISDEQVTTIKYHNYNKSPIDVYIPNYLKEGIIELIKRKIENCTGEKIVVALNQVSLCLDIAKVLVDQNILKKDKIAILCSQSRASEVKEYTSTITSIGILPGLLTFMTSAYFVGYDIDEPYHNIVVCDGNSTPLILNPSTVYQVAGRCRADTGLLSNTAIVKGMFNPGLTFNKFTSEELISNSSIADGISTLLKLTGSIHTEYARRFKIHLNKSIFNTNDFYLNVFRQAADGSDTAEISYFKIDEIIENQETQELYLNINNYCNRLQEWFTVNKHKLEVEPAQVEYNNVQDALVYTLKLVRQLTDNAKPKDYTKKIIGAINTTKPIKKSVKNLLDTYTLINEDPMFSKDKVLNEIESIITNEKQPSARLNDLRLYLEFEKLKHTGNSAVASNLELAYPVNSSQNITDLLAVNKRVQEIIQKTDTNSDLEKAFAKSIKSPKLSRRLHTLFFNVSIRNSNSVKTVTFSNTKKFNLLAEDQ